MKAIKIEEIFLMKDYDIIYVRKDAIYIQILDYERSNINEYAAKLQFLTSIIADIFNFELTRMIQRQRVEMTVQQIKNNFKLDNYYPYNSFVQYIPSDDESL